MKNVIAIVQARMGASRLPNKMMLHLHGYSMIEWVFQRASRARNIDTLVFALPETPQDDVLALHLTKLGANVFRGSEDDVLQRFYFAAKAYEASYVVRICADNPFISPGEIDNLVKFYFTTPCDYAYNNVPNGNRYPDGFGAEIVSFPLLERLHHEAHSQNQREHIFNFIWENRENLTIRTFDPPDTEIAFPDIKLDIDTYEDYYRLLEAEVSPQMDDRQIVNLFRSPLRG